jgi:hypothetical protein
MTSESPSSTGITKMLTVLLRVISAVAGGLLAVAAFYFPAMKFIADVQPDMSDVSSDPMAQLVHPFIDWSHNNSSTLIAAGCMAFIGFLLLRFAAHNPHKDSSMSYPGFD